MNSFSIVLGPCEICEETPARYEVGAQTCKSCGATFDKLCPACAKKPCPKCKGQLAPFPTVFPHSALKAIADGEVETLKQLLGQNEKRAPEHGASLLHAAACAKGKGVAKAMCETLISRGISASAATDYGRTALHEAVRCRLLNKEVGYLLSDSINDQDNGGCTALMFAAAGAGLFGSRRGNVSLAQDLLALGADPLICDKRGKTALGHAMASNDTDRNGEMIELLQDAMVHSQALAEFKDRYSCAFDKNGVLHCEARAPKRTGK